MSSDFRVTWTQRAHVARWIGLAASADRSSLAGVVNGGLTTSSSGIELGHASDTTLARVSAGVAAIEGDTVVTALRKIRLGTEVVTTKLTFADETDSDAHGADFAWLRPALRRAGYYRAGWPDGVRVDAVATKHAAPASLNFGQGANDFINGNAKLVFADGLLSGTLTNFVNIDPATGAVKLIPATTTAYTLNLTTSTGVFSGSFIHTSNGREPFRGILLNKGGNRGGFG